MSMSPELEPIISLASDAKLRATDIPSGARSLLRLLSFSGQTDLPKTNKNANPLAEYIPMIDTIGKVLKSP